MKKVLSIVLTLALLLTALPLALGITASAEAQATDVAYKLTMDAAGEFLRSTNNQASSSYAFSFDYYLVSGKVDVDLYSNPNIRKASLESGVSSFAYNGDIADKSFLITAVDGPAELYIWNVKVIVDGTEVEFESYEGRTNCKVEQTTYDQIPLPDETVVAYKLTMDAAGEFLRSTNNQASSSYAFSFDYYLVSGKVDVDLYSNPNIRKASLVSGVSSYAYNGDIADKSFLITAVDGPAELYIWNVKVIVDGTEVEFESYEGRTNCKVEQTTYDQITLPEVKNNALYIDATGCTSHTCIVLEQAIYNQPVGEYAIEFEYYTLESTADSQLNVRTGGNVGECAAPLNEKNFAKNAWLTYSSTIQNDNTALQINFFVWPGFKGYIDNIVLKKPDGSVAMELDFDKKTTGVLDIRDDTNVVVEVKECSENTTPACTHENKTTDITNATYLKDGLKVVTCDDCSEELSRDVLPAATNAVKDYKVTLNADNTVTISWGYTDEFVLDLAKDQNAVVKFNYKIAGYENAVVVNGNESGAVTLSGFNAARLGAELKYWISVESSVLGDTAKLVNETTKTVVASTLVDGDSDLGKLMAAINSATGEAAVVAGQVNNTDTLVSNTMKADLKAGTLDLRFVASQDLITKLNTLGKEGRT
ncbi:MAG: hypothetical protein E7545_02675, partial [Ruminococcaceae bacterium]|nr:hypothetical protein [Oscillospiraceae bacterium]